MRSGTASKVTSTFWFGATRVASDSSNGMTTWTVSAPSSTRNWVPPGRAIAGAAPPVDPVRDTVAVLLTQRAMTSPLDGFDGFWTAAARA